jgi:hypothetical protein
MPVAEDPETGDRDGAEHSDVLFFENGASWLWLLAGPAAALAMVFVQYRAGLGFRPTVPLMFLVMVSGFLGLQVKAARIHTSVELTATSLREGTQVTPIADILEVFGEPEVPVKQRSAISSWRAKPEPPREKWQASRALGELSGVPRGRTAVGIRLVGKARFAQAWARDHERLRTELLRLVQSR